MVSRSCTSRALSFAHGRREAAAASGAAFRGWVACWERGLAAPADSMRLRLAAGSASACPCKKRIKHHCNGHYAEPVQIYCLAMSARSSTGGSVAKDASGCFAKLQGHLSKACGRQHRKPQISPTAPRLPLRVMAGPPTGLLQEASHLLVGGSGSHQPCILHCPARTCASAHGGPPEGPTAAATALAASKLRRPPARHPAALERSFSSGSRARMAARPSGRDPAQANRS